MNIVEKRLDEIRPYANNPRKNDEAVEAVANSIREFGWKQPIVVDADGVIIVGHTRYKAAQMLGLKTVPVLVADDLQDDKVKAYRLADNKTNELAEWDLSALEMELAQIDMDMSEFGFESISPDGFGDDFLLADGDRQPVQNMTFTFSDEQAEKVNEAIREMKHTSTYAEYDEPNNKNGNGNALYLVVLEWLQQRI